uniref:Actin n=1 Tax=Mesocestoides corti TaxID=53468 RepID=A0A5K3FBW8_MESCO
MAKERLPSAVIPTIVGENTQQSTLVGMDGQDYYVGDEAKPRLDLVAISHPVESGVVTNWDDMERILRYIYENKLRVSPEEHPVLVTEAVLNSKHNREKMATCLFETFNVPAMYVAIQAALSLYSSGRTTGVAVEIGDCVSQIVPIYESYTLPQAIHRFRLADDRGYTFPTTAKRDSARDIKEKLCYVALDFKDEISNATSSPLNKEYRCPDGEVINVGDEAFRCPEALFQPKLIDYECPGIHKSIVDSIKICDLDTRKDLYAGVLISGGSSMFPGLARRLKKELTAMVPATVAVNVCAQPERNYSVWTGGSILASLSTFPEMLIKRKEYDETGPNIVHEKCF